MAGPGTDKFYTVRPTKYQSQFVPMPLDFLAKTAAQSQKKYDTQSALIDKDALWDQEALGWHDKQWVEGKKKELQEFQNSMMGKDLGSSKVQREYAQFMRKFRDDENIKKVQSAVDTHAKYLKTKEALQKSGKYEDAAALENNYLRRLGEYTKEGGEGFKGAIGLGDPLIRESVSIYDEGSKFFKDLKDSGSDSIKYLASDQGKIAYKNGWTGVSNSRVEQQFNNMLHDFRNTAGGQQLEARYNYEKGLADFEIAAMNPEQRMAYEQDKENYIANQFLQIGRTFVHGKSTTGIDAAINKSRDEGIVAKQNVTLTPVITSPLAPTEEGYKAKDLLAGIGNLQAENEQLAAQLQSTQNPQLQQQIQKKIDLNNREIALNQQEYAKKAGDIEKSIVDNMAPGSRNNPKNIEQNLTQMSNQVIEGLNLGDEDAAKLNTAMANIAQNGELTTLLNDIQSGKFSREELKAIAEGQGIEYGLSDYTSSLISGVEGIMDFAQAVGASGAGMVPAEGDAVPIHQQELDQLVTGIVVNALGQEGFNTEEAMASSDQAGSMFGPSNVQNLVTSYATGFANTVTAGHRLNDKVSEYIANGQDDPTVVYNYENAISLPQGDMKDLKGNTWKDLNSVLEDDFYKTDDKILRNPANGMDISEPIKKTINVAGQEVEATFDYNQAKNLIFGDYAHSGITKRTEDGAVEGKTGDGYLVSGDIPVSYIDPESGKVVNTTIKDNMYVENSPGSSSSQVALDYLRIARDNWTAVNPESQDAKDLTNAIDKIEQSVLTKELDILPYNGTENSIKLGKLATEQGYDVKIKKFDDGTIEAQVWKTEGEYGLGKKVGQRYFDNQGQAVTGLKGFMK